MFNYTTSSCAEKKSYLKLLPVSFRITKKAKTMGAKQNIDFKFAKNWRTFLKWYDAHKKTGKLAPPWEIQKEKIIICFAEQASGIVNWKTLWIQFEAWRKEVYNKKLQVLWSEQRRAIETFMLNQLTELNKEQFVLIFLHKGKPEVDTNKMTYFEAIRVKDQLSGDSNGIGGNTDMDKITVINLASLIQ